MKGEPLQGHLYLQVTIDESGPFAGESEANISCPMRRGDSVHHPVHLFGSDGSDVDLSDNKSVVILEEALDTTCAASLPETTTTRILLSLFLAP